MRKLSIVVAVALLVAVTKIAFADDVFWTGTGDGYKWSNAANWAGQNPPVDKRGDNVYLTSQPDQQVSLDASTYPVHINSLQIDNGMQLRHSYNNGHALVSNSETIGINGTALFKQDGSSDVINSGLVVGQNTAALGKYQIDEGGSLWAGHEVVSQSATGAGSPYDAGGIFFDGYHSDNTVVADNAVAVYDKNGNESWTVTDANALNGLTIAQKSGSTGEFDLSEQGTLNCKRSLLVDNTGNAVKDGQGNNIYIGGNEYVGYGGKGTFDQQQNSINNVDNDLILGAQPGSVGIYTMQATYPNDQLNIGGDLVVGDAGQGTFVQNDGTTDVQGNIIISRSGGQGNFNLNGGTVKAKSIANYGVYNVVAFEGASTSVQSGVQNNGVISVSGGGTVSFAGPVSCGGTISSDPSTLIFNNLTMTETGVIKATNDTYIMQGDFVSHSTKNKDWDTTQATLVFDNNPAGHTFAFTGADLGANPAGFTDNFAWGTFDATNATQIDLQNGTSGGKVALYTRAALVTIFNNSISNILGNGYNIYYDPASPLNAYLGDKTYAFNNGGSLMPIGAAPEPASMLLFGVGGLALAAFRRKNKSN